MPNPKYQSQYNWKEYLKKWKIKNPEKLKEQRKRYRQKHFKTIQLRNKEWRKKYREKYDKYQLFYRLKTKYKITADEYQKLLESQKNKCAICEEKNKLEIDHNHKTGKVRGLLCNYCNTALGLVRDNPKILRKMIKYLSNK